MNHKGIRGGMAGIVGLACAVGVASVAVASRAGVWRFEDGLRDYDTATSSPFDNARAKLQLVTTDGRTTAVLHVRDVDAKAAGATFGAHLHNGPCATNAPSLSSTHYNHLAHAGITPVLVSAGTEIWLDFTVDASGAGDASTVVQFAAAAGERSVVVHASPTNPATGAAGPRLACLPVEW